MQSLFFNLQHLLYAFKMHQVLNKFECHRLYCILHARNCYEDFYDSHFLFISLNDVSINLCFFFIYFTMKWKEIKWHINRQSGRGCVCEREKLLNICNLIMQIYYMSKHTFALDAYIHVMYIHIHILCIILKCIKLWFPDFFITYS